MLADERRRLAEVGRRDEESIVGEAELGLRAAELVTGAGAWLDAAESAATLDASRPDGVPA